jgi:hypothetical protein
LSVVPDCKTTVGSEFHRPASGEVMGACRVVYWTKKGSDKMLTDYAHELESPRPRLAYNESGLVIAGGKYCVADRGIVD